MPITVRLKDGIKSKIDSVGLEHIEAAMPYFVRLRCKVCGFGWCPDTNRWGRLNSRWWRCFYGCNCGEAA